MNRSHEDAIFSLAMSMGLNEAPIVEKNIFVKQILGLDPGKISSALKASGINDFGRVTFNETSGLTKVQAHLNPLA